MRYKFIQLLPLIGMASMTSCCTHAVKTGKLQSSAISKSVDPSIKPTDWQKQACLEDLFNRFDRNSFTNEDIDALCNNNQVEASSTRYLNEFERRISNHLTVIGANIKRQDPKNIDALHVTINEGISPYDLASPTTKYTFDKVFSKGCDDIGGDIEVCKQSSYGGEEYVCIEDNENDQAYVSASFSVSFRNDQEVGYNGPRIPEYSLFITSNHYARNIRDDLAGNTNIDLDDLDGGTAPDSETDSFEIQTPEDWEADGYICEFVFSGF